jgi:hypothetical protein
MRAMFAASLRLSSSRVGVESSLIFIAALCRRGKLGE